MSSGNRFHHYDDVDDCTVEQLTVTTLTYDSIRMPLETSIGMRRVIGGVRCFKTISYTHVVLELYRAESC